MKPIIAKGESDVEGKNVENVIHKIENTRSLFYVYQCWSIRRRINRLDKNYSGGRRLYKREDLRKSSQQLSLTLCLSQVPFFHCPLPLTLFKLKLKDQLKHFQVLRFRPLPIVRSSNSGSRAYHAKLLLLHRSRKNTLLESTDFNVLDLILSWLKSCCHWLCRCWQKGSGGTGLGKGFFLIIADCDDSIVVRFTDCSILKPKGGFWLQSITIDQFIVLFQVTVENCEFSQSEETETCVRWIWTQW